MEDTAPLATPIETIPPIPEGKVYTEKEVWRGTLLGGPLTAAYFFAANYKLFGDTKKAKWSWIWGILSTILIFSTLILIPKGINDKIPNMLFPFIQATIVYFLVPPLQGEKINAHLNAGGKKYNWGRTILVSLIGCVVTIIPIIITYMLFILNTSKGTNYDSEETYNTVQNEIYYNKSNIDRGEIFAIGNELQQDGYFDNISKKDVAVDKSGNSYNIALFCTPVIKETNFDFSALQRFTDSLQSHFPNNKIMLLLCIDSRDSVVKTFKPNRPGLLPISSTSNAKLLNRLLFRAFMQSNSSLYIGYIDSAKSFLNSCPKSQKDSIRDALISAKNLVTNLDHDLLACVKNDGTFDTINVLSLQTLNALKEETTKFRLDYDLAKKQMTQAVRNNKFIIDGIYTKSGVLGVKKYRNNEIEKNKKYDSLYNAAILQLFPSS